MNTEKEKLYHSSTKEPLGGHYTHGLYVPEYAKHPDYRFGAGSDKGDHLYKPLVTAVDSPCVRLLGNPYGTKELVQLFPDQYDSKGDPEVHRR